ncbi:MAG: U32 family peptidase, partial [Lachnospiraceae bacterium]|nr:U32 family peptidase [Lachnospiraceae bacterium]
MRTMEVLAPAGNLEIFKTVIDAGADAVYFGGKLFSARAYADNFDFKDSALALEYAHLHDKKAYLTLNTLVKNIEFNKELFDYINFYYQNGLDGIIVQDIGVIKYIRDNFPALNVHGSTQLAICNEDGANLMQDMGVTRVVPARELSLDEISKIHDNTNLELEIFVHGALCYSYSGDCLFSSMVGGRSGNRGRCAQPCRLEYSVYDGQKAVKTKGGYILSLKDLCGIDDLYNLYKSGASSLKIEGRMKQKQYASNVVNIYKRYVDRVMENVLSEKEEYIVDEVDKKLLYDLGNRCGFTDSYYYNKTDDMVTFTRPNHQSKDIDYEYFEDKLQVKCTFTAHINRETELEINYKDISVKRFGKLTELAGKKPVSIEDIDKRLKKTGNTSFEIADVTYDIDDNIFIPLGEINRLRREALDELKSKIISNYIRESIDSESLSENNRKHNHSKADYTFTEKKEEGYNNDCKSEKVSGLIITVSS